MVTLAVKYRPKTFDDVTEQGSTKTILNKQIESGTIKNAYLFTGGAGTGKTTCARIFAHEINKGEGIPIEMDAASNNGVDDVREIIEQSKTKSLDSEYKVFIIDECHMITVPGWNAFLKVLEEPPLKSVFIFCTTDPQKIPKTILSRVQRYDFQRISYSGIYKRLITICDKENIPRVAVNSETDATNSFLDRYVKTDALEYISKVADGGMRDAITMLDECLSFSDKLTLEDVIKTIGTVDYGTMFKLNDAIFSHDTKKILSIINDIHYSGKDLKQFIKTYLEFTLDINKYECLKSFDLIHIPNLYSEELSKYGDYEYEVCNRLLTVLVKLSSDIKWETSVKSVVEATLLLMIGELK